MKGGKKWKPHSKLRDSDNYFIHALFYILKDIRDVKDSTAMSQWLDPDAEEFSKIRNAIEHRSLKIIDDSGLHLIHSGEKFRQSQLEKIQSEFERFKESIEKLNDEVEQEKDDEAKKILRIKRKAFEKGLNQAECKLHEHKKLSSHSVLITESEFESRLMTLMKLARNSIMYLSLAIQFEEKNKPEDLSIRMPKVVPLKSSA